MRKLFLVITLWCCCVVSVAAQDLTPAQAREAEWRSYALPQTNFVRQKDHEENLVFRVPADWKAETSSSFIGPHSASIRVYVQAIPDGYPLQEYFTSVLKAVQDSASSPEATVVRKTQVQDLDAREIFLENAGADGEVTRNVSWITVNGPLAVTVNFQAPIAHAAELEPVFKAVVQSIIFLPLDHAAFEKERTSVMQPVGVPIHELESITASLSGLGVDREPAITRLATFFSSQPDAAIDLLIDRRPIVRATAVQALVRANKSSLAPFLWIVVDDKDPFVAEAAARVVATKPDVIEQLVERSLFGHAIDPIARVWPFMPKDKRLDLLQRIFSQIAKRESEPPPPATKPAAKPRVTVAVKELRAVKPNDPELLPPAQNFSNDPNVQIGALTLLLDVPREDFKLPLERIIASNNDELIAAALQVEYLRGEPLPIEPLLKLVKSTDSNVSKAAAQDLTLLTTAADLQRLEALVSKDEAKNPVNDEIKLSIRKLHLRQDWNAAKTEDQRRAIVSKAYADATLASYAWLLECEATVAGCANSQTPIKPDLAIKPFAENLFPKKVRHYIAIPKPGEAVAKFYETLQGLQLDSPRVQANFALILNGVRQLLAQQLDAPAGSPALLEYTGIDTNAPIVLGSWTAGRAVDSVSFAQRRAIVLRVKDRARFERIIQQVQNTTGTIAYMADYLAVGTRGIAALPAFLPLTAQAIVSPDPAKRKTNKPLLKSYAVIGDKEWNGLHIRTIEQRRLNGDGQFENYITYLTYLGDTAIITADLPTLRDLLSNEGHTSLADNNEFRKAVAQHGDVVYFSDVRAVFADASEANKSFDFKIDESGALNITNTSWENTHHLVFDESDWTKPLAPFHPKDLSAPRELLPASTIAYFLMSVDLKLGWSGELRTSFLPDDKDVASLWALNFKDEVLPELGPECGVAILELPGVLDHEKDSWAVFCKLKSNKLVEALNAGKLFTNVGPTTDVAQLKIGAVPYFVTARNGFLIVANREHGLTAFDGKTNLAATRDYSRAVEKVPGDVLAFGGYNLEAAVAAVRKPDQEGLNGNVANIVFSIASAFHSQKFYATATPGTIEAHSSVSMDREGRYSVADFSELSKGGTVTYAMIEPAGLPIADQNRISSLVLRVKSRSTGPIENIRDDVKTVDQVVEQKSANELLLRVAARRGAAEKSVTLPVQDPEFAPYLKATKEFGADDESVSKQAVEIAGLDRDAWSVAQKLADWTHQNLEWKAVARADVGQTLATREADCSEFSALFIAMARSLGLPARLVSGLAYSGVSFGGHAWVEVWAGKWIELDPTWGTHFVDATHIRNQSGALVTSAALNLIELEVVEAHRSVTDFQKTPLALTQHLLKAIPNASKSDIEAVLDLGVLTDELMGAGTWVKMSDAERDQMSSAYRRALREIIDGYGSKSGWFKMRLLHLEEKDNAAEAICVIGPYELLLKLRLIRRDGVWYLAEILQNDANFHTVAEAVQPTITAIENARAGRKGIVPRTDVTRVLVLMQSDATKALAVAESALSAKPTDQTLRLLKASALSRLKKTDDAKTVWRELSNENFAPAIRRLASELNQSEDDKELAEAMTLYKRYTQLEPYDSRGFRDLGAALERDDEQAEAEVAYRKVVELNPADAIGYVKLVLVLAMQEKFAETKSVLEAADKFKDDDTDVFGEVMDNLHINADSEIAEPFAASEPQRMKTSSQANLALGRIYSGEIGREANALRYLHAAVLLDKKSSMPHTVIASVYRKQHRWLLALREARQAIALDDEDGEAYFELACALARLARFKEAITALEKFVELYPEDAESIATEPDLKPLANLPAFKKLIPPEQKSVP